jgi:putative ABC transport system permease protein
LTIARLALEEYSMFFVTYLGRELRRRMRQAVFIALGLALGVGLVVTDAAASARVNSAAVSKAQVGVLGALYGVGTDVTVTGPPVLTGRFRQVKVGGQTNIEPNANGAEVCRNGKCAEVPAGQSVQLVGPPYSTVTSTDVAAVARLHDVSAAAGGLLLSDNAETIPKDSGQGGPPPTVFYFSVDGVDTGHLALGPLSAGTIISGRSLTAGDAGSDVAVVDSGYAASNNLKVGSALTIDGVAFTVIGIVRQPTATTPDDVYIPLAAAQALQLADGSAGTGEVNMIYVTAASAVGIPAIQREIARLLPHATVTTAASLASEVTSAVSGAARLASNLGRWLALLVLVAAFAVTSLLTLAAVARRAAEFGTLKVLGWRTRRIAAQVLGESVAMGIAGAAAGVGLGFAGAAIITTLAPKLPVTVPGSSGASSQAAAPGAIGELDPATASHVVAVPVHPSVTVGVIVLAVLLAVAGGLLAGALGSWRIARLRPADALAQVA